MNHATIKLHMRSNSRGKVIRTRNNYPEQHQDKFRQLLEWSDMVYVEVLLPDGSIHFTY